MIVLTDADEVLENLSEVWVGLLNETYGTQVKIEDVLDWDMCKAFPTLTPYQILKSKMDKVLLKYFPFLTWKNFIITSNKKLIAGDVLIDDGVHNLIGAPYKKILKTAPWNKDFDAEANEMIRVKDWKEIEEALIKLNVL